MLELEEKVQCLIDKQYFELEASRNKRLIIEKFLSFVDFHDRNFMFTFMPIIVKSQ